MQQGRSAGGRALGGTIVVALGVVAAVFSPPGAAEAPPAEVLTVAPDADDAATEVVTRRKNLRLLLTGGMPDARASGLTFRSLSGGFLAQDVEKVFPNWVTEIDAQGSDIDLKGVDLVRPATVAIRAFYRLPRRFAALAISGWDRGGSDR